MQRRFGDQVRFVGVPGLAEPESMVRFVSDTGAGAFPHIPDGEGVIWERFGVTQQRTYVFIDDDGTVRRAGYGNLLGDVEDLIAS